MTNNSNNESLEELFNCSICFNQYNPQDRIPMLLPCQHSFCGRCLPELVKYTILSNKQQQQSSSNGQTSYIQCPFCNKKYYMSVNDVPKNRIILQLLEASHGNVLSIHPPSMPSAPPPPLLPQSTNNYSMPYNPKQPAPPPPSYMPYPAQQVPTRPAPQVPTRPPPPVPNRISPVQTSSHQWNENDYLHKIFNDVDINGDGTITFSELHNALRRGQPNSKFDLKTVELLVNKYDTNNDGEINFREFENIFNYINEEYLKFLLADSDGSESIDAEELEVFLKERGYKFKKDFYNYVTNEIKSHTGEAITFDYYCRFMARFDYLVKQHSTVSYYKSYPLENYLKQTFFMEFW